MGQKNRIEVDCDVDEQGYQCVFKKDGKVVDKAVGKDVSQMESEISKRFK